VFCILSIDQGNYNVFGISRAALKWIALHLTDCSQVVVIDSKHSKPVLLKYGVPQGMVLGSKKYTMYAKPLGVIICRHVHTAIHLIQAKRNVVKAQSLSLIDKCLTDIEGWMCTKYIKPNMNRLQDTY